MQHDLVDGIAVVGAMTAEREDGTRVEVLWLTFSEEPEDSAAPYEVLEDGHLVPCDLGKLSDWRRLAALVGGEGGG